MPLSWKRHPDTSLHATGAEGRGPTRHYAILDGKLTLISMGRVSYSRLGTEAELRAAAEDLDAVERGR